MSKMRMMRVMRGVYAGAGAAVGAMVALRSALSAGEGKVRDRERRGHWAGHAGAAQPWIWIHGASLGEADIAVAVAGEILRQCPGVRVVISSMTSSGKARVSRMQGVQPRYFPIDYAPFVKRILKPEPPRLFVAVETEIWPETLRLLHERLVPVAFVNARLSEISLPRYLRLRALLAPLLAPVARVCARDADSAARWQAIGVPAAAVDVTGNIKFDLAAAPRDAAALFRRDAAMPIVLAASTHEGEEALALDAFVRVRARRPGVRLLLAPRHPERAAAVLALAAARGMAVKAWSEFGDDAAPASWPSGADVVVLDRLGLLHAAYRCANAAYVGGSAAPGPGGHNLLEAIAAGCPVASGPHLENVADQVSVLAAAAALRIVDDVDGLSTFWLEVLEEPHRFCDSVRTADADVSGRRGALERTMRALAPLLPRRAAGGPD